MGHTYILCVIPTLPGLVWRVLHWSLFLQSFEDSPS